MSFVQLGQPQASKSESSLFFLAVCVKTHPGTLSKKTLTFPLGDTVKLFYQKLYCMAEMYAFCSLGKQQLILILSLVWNNHLCNENSSIFAMFTSRIWSSQKIGLGYLYEKMLRS
jgi:hypothetical protein